MARTPPCARKSAQERHSDARRPSTSCKTGAHSRQRQRPSVPGRLTPVSGPSSAATANVVAVEDAPAVQADSLEAERLREKWEKDFEEYLMEDGESLLAEVDVLLHRNLRTSDTGRLLNIYRGKEPGMFFG